MIESALDLHLAVSRFCEELIKPKEKKGWRLFEENFHVRKLLNKTLPNRFRRALNQKLDFINQWYFHGLPFHWCTWAFIRGIGQLKKWIRFLAAIPITTSLPVLLLQYFPFGHWSQATETSSDEVATIQEVWIIFPLRFGRKLTACKVQWFPDRCWLWATSSTLWFGRHLISLFSGMNFLSTTNDGPKWHYFR